MTSGSSWGLVQIFVITTEDFWIDTELRWAINHAISDSIKRVQGLDSLLRDSLELFITHIAFLFDIGSPQPRE
jgi:hypothetical protein